MRTIYIVFLIAIAALPVLMAPGATGMDEISALTYVDTYEPGDPVYIYVFVPEESNIAVEVRDPQGDLIHLESTSDEGGIASIELRLHDNAREGTYHVHASAVANESKDTAFDSWDFEVKRNETGWAGIEIPDVVVPVLVGAMITGSLLVVGSMFHEPLKYLMLSALLPLYTRIHSKDIEDSVVRAQILGYLRHHPGANYSSIKRDLLFSNGQLTHHLKMLENAGRIKSQSHGVNKLFYPRDYRVPDNEFDISPSFAIQRNILDILAHNPGLNQKQLVGILGRDRKTVSLHLNTLSSKGRIRMEKRGREIVYFPYDVEPIRPQMFDKPITGDERHF